LPALRLQFVLGARKTTSPDRHGRWRIFRPRIPSARSGRVDQGYALLAGASWRNKDRRY